MTGHTAIRYEGSVAILELRNGKNTFTVEFVSEIHKALDEVLRNEDVKVLITTGQGKFYSNGLNLDAIAHRGSEGVVELLQHVCLLLRRILVFPLPTVAVLNGHAFAGGALFALAHDYRVMNANRGWFCLPEVLMPARFPKFLLELARYKLPQGQAQADVILMGKRCTGPDSLKVGAVQKIADPQQLMSEGVAFAKSLVAWVPLPRASVQAMKEDLWAAVLARCDKEGMKPLSNLLDSKL